MYLRIVGGTVLVALLVLPSLAQTDFGRSVNDTNNHPYLNAIKECICEVLGDPEDEQVEECLPEPMPTVLLGLKEKDLLRLADSKDMDGRVADEVRGCVALAGNLLFPLLGVWNKWDLKAILVHEGTHVGQTTAGADEPGAAADCGEAFGTAFKYYEELEAGAAALKFLFDAKDKADEAGEGELWAEAAEMEASYMAENLEAMCAAMNKIDEENLEGDKEHSLWHLFMKCKEEAIEALNDYNDDEDTQDVDNPADDPNSACSGG